MRYGILFAVLCGLCGYFIGQTYYSRGRADCEHEHIITNQESVAAVQHVQATVARDVLVTGVADIRQRLREKYTIAD